MNNIAKFRSSSSALADNSSIIASTQNAASFQRILYRRPPPTTPYAVLNSIDNSHTNDLLTRSIIIDSAVRERGFLPYDYRIANTFDSIRRQRSHLKPLSKLPSITPRIFNRTSTRSDAFGNVSSTMSKLAEQRLVIREKSVRIKKNASPAIDKHEKSFLAMSDADFATDIPNALEIIFQNTKRKSTMEQHLLEALKRERLHQARYRLLPINRAPYI